MDIMTNTLPHISLEKINSILSKSEITQQDRFDLQSYVFIMPLHKKCIDLSASELAEVNSLESKNIYKVISCAAIIADVQQKLFASAKVNEILSIAEGDKRMEYYLLFKFMLANFDLNSNKAVFDGRMPQKLFKFRQQTAELWFDDYVSQIAKFASLVYASLGSEEALAYVTGATAYFLNSSQPNRYSISSTDNINDSLYKIITKFIADVSGNNDIILRKIVK